MQVTKSDLSSDLALARALLEGWYPVAANDVFLLASFASLTLRG